MLSVITFLVKCFCKLVFFVRVKGAENIPDEGPVILAVNHTSLWDPPVIVSSIRRPMKVMAKAELFDIKLLAPILRAGGAFPVHRNTADISAIKTALRTLKNGGIFTIFPAGTRVKNGEEADAKAGVALISSKAGVPVTPVAIRGGYRLFRRVTIHIGKPLCIANKDGSKPSGDDLKAFAEMISKEIDSLGVE